MIELPAARHPGVALQRQHQGKQQRESDLECPVQPHSTAKHTTARGIIHANRAHLGIGLGSHHLTLETESWLSNGYWPPAFPASFWVSLPAGTPNCLVAYRPPMHKFKRPENR